MNTQEQIKHLFEKLNTDDQILILEELHRVNNSNNEPPNAASVENCPYCSSVLLSKNGHRGVQLRYKGYYKDFIENLSERTYRCPTKRNWSSPIQNKDIIGVNAYL